MALGLAGKTIIVSVQSILLPGGHLHFWRVGGRFGGAGVRVWDMLEFVWGVRGGLAK